MGSLYEKNSYDELEHRLTDYLRGYFDAVMEIQSDLYGSNIVQDSLTTEILEKLQEHYVLEKSEDSFSDLGLVFSVTTLGFKIAQIQRIRDLLALAKVLPVSIYSNSDVSELMTVQYKGGVEYWTEMPKVFAMSKVNLNFTIPNIRSGIPLRVWDVLGAGGFLLTNFQAELPMYFKEGEDLVSFYGKEDLVEKAKWYYTHEAQRKQIARNGHEKVKKYHSYEVRVREMLDQI